MANSCSYCSLCHKTCDNCIQHYIQNATKTKKRYFNYCLKFTSYDKIILYYEGRREESIYDIIDTRIQFHERVIEFLMGMPEYATDDYIFDRIKQLELE